MSTNVFVFVTAAFLEIAGCFAFWSWLRREASPLVALIGVGSLIGFAVALTREWSCRSTQESYRFMTRRSYCAPASSAGRLAGLWRDFSSASASRVVPASGYSENRSPTWA